MNYHPRLAEDRNFASARSAFIRAKKLVLQYGARLRKIARHVGDVVSAFDVSTPEGQILLQTQLRRYADVLTPWAEATAERMVAEVAQADAQSWRKMSADIGRNLRREIETAPTGAVMQRLKAEQIDLITSLPREAAERVHRITTEGISRGTRASEVAEQIMRTGDVTRSRADLVARTEVGRTSTTLTQARAEHIGSTGYIWRTSKDSDVRPSHKAMEGRFVAWADPPTLDNLKGHAGALPNCRCYCEPVLPDN